MSSSAGKLAPAAGPLSGQQLRPTTLRRHRPSQSGEHESQRATLALRLHGQWPGDHADGVRIAQVPSDARRSEELSERGKCVYSTYGRGK